MNAAYTLICLILGANTAPASAQIVTVSAPLPDKNGDGRVRVGAMADQLKVRRGTTLIRCGKPLTYVGPCSTCPPDTAGPAAETRRIVGRNTLLPDVPQEVGTAAPGAMDRSFTSVAVPMIAIPAITSRLEQGSANAGAPRRSNLHLARALDAYVLNGSGLTISDVTIDLSRYGVTMRRADGSYGMVSGLTMKRVAITAEQAPVYIRGGSHDILIEDATLTCTGTSAGIPGGVKVGKAKSPPNYNIRLNRVLVQGCASSAARKGYKQGDGFASERPDHDIVIENSVFRGMGDGCIDTKSTAVTIRNVTLDGCNWGMRLWGQGHAGDVHVVAVRKAAVQIKPTADWTIERIYLPKDISSQGDIYVDGDGGKVTISWCSRPVVVRGGTANITLGQGCGVGRSGESDIGRHHDTRLRNEMPLSYRQFPSAGGEQTG